MERWRERELTYEVTPEWQDGVPSAVVPAGGLVRSSTKHLVNVYYDTEDHSLLGHGVTLRRRSGGGEDGWQLKLPLGNAREELRFDDAEELPSGASDLLVGIRRGRRLSEVARIETNRTAHLIENASGKVLAELADDEVRADLPGDAHVPTSWREIEIELVEGDEQFLRRADKAMLRAGATRSAVSSKLARAVGAPHRPVAQGNSTRPLVQRYLRTHYERILAGDLDLRRGQDAVHRTRVAIRRYRSVLRVFADGFDAEAAAHLDAELAWFATVLGAARDAQVLSARLDKQLANLPEDVDAGPVHERLHRELNGRAGRARGRFGRTLRGKRYTAILATLAQWDVQPPLSEAGFRAPKYYLRRSRRKAVARLRAATDPDLPAGEMDAALHRARKAAKRARYTAEVLRPRLGQPACRQRASAKHVQDVLGEGQDAVVAAALLYDLGAQDVEPADRVGFMLGVLWAAEQERRRAVHAAAATLVIRH